jgi:ethanolamine utilization protein EutA
MRHDAIGDHHHATGDHHHHHHADDIDAEMIGEAASLTSVGIDIGSATSQVVFSQIRLARDTTALTSMFRVVDRTVSYRSRTSWTPFRQTGEVDAERVTAIVREAHREAGIGEVDCGVVILTGEAAAHASARPISAALAGEFGNLVTAAAGDQTEGWLAAHGSGTVECARTTAQTVLNIDIGGATTKFTMVNPAGQVAWSAAIDIGGRVAAFDDHRQITRLTASGARLAHASGFEWRAGRVVPAPELAAVGQFAAAAIAGFLPGQDTSRRWLPACRGEFPPYSERADRIVVSGGVSRLVTPQPSAWGQDLGGELGHRFWAELDRAGLIDQVSLADEHATVIGAAEFSVQVSGRTIYGSDRGGVLPLRNLKVARPWPGPAPVDSRSAEQLRADIRREIESVPAGVHGRRVILAFSWSGAPSYRRLSALAGAVAGAVDESVDPLCLAVDADVSQLLSRLIVELDASGRAVVGIDGIALDALDYVDLGPAQGVSGVVPVVVRSIVFG